MENNQTPEKELSQLVSRAMDSPGYLFFAAFLTPRRDEEGNLIIDFNYRRYHFSLEDSRLSIQALKKFVDEEYQKIIDEYRDQANEMP